MERVLSGLWHVQGVVGSFVTDRGGKPLATALPPFVDPSELASAVARLASILEAVGELEAGPQACTLCFTDHHLHVHVFTGGCLGIIAEPLVNSLALRMACRLAQRKLQGLIQGFESSVASSHPAPLRPADFEVQAHGTSPMNTERATEDPRQALHQTQPSMIAHQVRPPSNPATAATDSSTDVPTPNSKPGGGAEVLAPEARSRQRPTVGRTLVYRGRRYQVPG